MAEIEFFNTLGKEKKVFTPITQNKVTMYNCGPTVYSKPQIGNMRAYVFADTIKRALTYNGFEVKQVINITDVGHLTDDGDDGDDKMEKSAKEQGKKAADIAQHFTEIFYNYLDQLNINREDILFTKATDHINEQIDMIKALEEKGHTYITSDGVYFDISTKKDYGKLGQVHTDDSSQDGRIKTNEEKRNNADFALWKFSKPEDERQQEWESPWGVGFPGWHIECSAMSHKYLGSTFDIHTGGIDHIPTHHNNEIAQSESVNEVPQANFWMHSSHVLIDGQKISKSLGNTLYLEDLDEKQISPLGYRYWLLTADYKTLMNFTWDSVSAANSAYQKIIAILAVIPQTGTINEHYKEIFLSFINDDLNTAGAIATIWKLLKDTEVSDEDKKATIFDFDIVLGLNIEAVSTLAQNIATNQQQEIPQKIIEIAEKREIARQNKDWETADTLRNEALQEGFEIKDTESGFEVIHKL